MRFFISCGIIVVVYLAYVNSDACVQCDSSTDIKCAVNPNAFLAKECRNASSKCYTRVKDGHTIRGCSVDLDNATASHCDNEMECIICSFAEGCNREIFPKHRASCVQCSGNDDNSTCATFIHRDPSYCPIYKLGDKCVIRKDGRNNNNSVLRGCLSSIQADGLCKDIANCYTCEGAGCNFLELNSPVIPMARDSAIAYGAPLLLLLVSVMTSHFF